MAQRRIINGAFQNALGAPLNGGSLKIRLNTDAQVGTTQLFASTVVTVPLDANGNVSGTVLLWPNDQMTPTTAAYVVKAFDAAGQLTWGPNLVIIPSGAGSYDLSNWVPSVSNV